MFTCRLEIFSEQNETDQSQRLAKKSKAIFEKAQSFPLKLRAHF